MHSDTTPFPSPPALPPQHVRHCRFSRLCLTAAPAHVTITLFLWNIPGKLPTSDLLQMSIAANAIRAVQTNSRQQQGRESGHMSIKSNSNKVEPTPPHANLEPGSTQATSASVPPKINSIRQWLYETDNPMSTCTNDRAATDSARQSRTGGNAAVGCTRWRIG